MITITINKLIFSGIHGVTEKEQRTAQRFTTTLSLECDINPKSLDDTIDNTLDYREVKKIVKNIIEGERCNLLETLAYQIAEKILLLPFIVRATISITKPDIWDNGSPSVVITRSRRFNEFELLDFDYRLVSKELMARGGVSFPILPVERRLKLLTESENYEYIPQPEYPQSPLVREQLSSVTSFPDTSLFYTLRKDFESHLKNLIPSIIWNQLFPTPLIFNDLSLQFYEKGSIGITPHKDGKSCINIICIFILKGRASVGICDDREGSNPYYLDASPGNVIIIRGPEFIGSSYQPFHFVKDIMEDRIVFGLRQKISPITNT